MEIIVRGNRLEVQRAKAAAWSREIRHRRCGSVLRVGAADVQAVPNIECSWDYEVRCPVCGDWFWPWLAPIPDEVRLVARERTTLPRTLLPGEPP